MWGIIYYLIDCNKSMLTTFTLHGLLADKGPLYSQANTSGPIVVSMLGQRHRRWANIETTMGQLLMFGRRAVLMNYLYIMV